LDGDSIILHWRLSSFETKGCTRRNLAISVDDGFGRIGGLEVGSGRVAVRSVSESGTGGIVKIGTDGIRIMTGRVGYAAG
jgi:hypothetical protein